MGARSMSDTVTLLQAASGQRLAKRVREDKSIDNYDRVKFFNVSTARVSSLQELLVLLTQVASRRDICVVRGALLHGAKTAKEIRRLLTPCPQSGDGPYFSDRPRRWLSIDIDGLPLPSRWTFKNLADCYRWAIVHLPPELHPAACIVQATGSHGFKPGARMRLWFWLSRPLNTAQVKQWLGPCLYVDRAIFGPVQPIYTAAPQIHPKLRDPMPSRLYFHEGAPIVEAPRIRVKKEALLADSINVALANDPATLGLTLVKLTQTVSHAHNGERNRLAFWAGCRVGELATLPGFKIELARDTLVGAAKEAGLEPDEAYHAVTSGIQSGIISGMKFKSASAPPAAAFKG